MKFWFGKKDEEQSAREVVSCDVPAHQIHAEESETSRSSLFVAPPQLGPRAGVQGPVATSNHSSSSTPVSSENDVLIQPQEKAVQELHGLAPQTVQPKVPVSTVQVKPVLRPVGGVSVRAVATQASQPAAAPVPAPVSAVMKQNLSSAAAAPTPTVSFGLRPKANGVQAEPMVSATESAVKTLAIGPASERRKDDNDAIIRPKADQRALYYELMNGLYDAVLILDDQGHVVDSNSRVVDVLGYSRDESWDLPIKKIITGMTPQIFEHLRRSLMENNHVLIDARCFRKDESSFMGEVGVSTLSLTRAGSNIVFAIRNVERRKNAMEELRKGQLALQIALAPAFVCDTDGLFQIVNQAFLEAFGIPDEKQAKSVRFVDLLPDAARFFLRAACGEKIKESVLVPLPQGGTAKVELSLSPVQNGQDVTAVAGSLLQA